jgi:hypothetical protein
MRFNKLVNVKDTLEVTEARIHQFYNLIMVHLDNRLQVSFARQMKVRYFMDNISGNTEEPQIDLHV